MRTRVFQSIDNPPQVKGYLQKVNGVVTYNLPSGYSFPGSSSRNYMIDVVTQNFQKRSKQGEIINNEMLHVTSTSSAVPIQYYVAGTSGMEQWLWRSVSKPVVPNPQSVNDAFFSSFDFDRNVAINAAWSNINQEELLIGATLGELPETIKWIVSIFSRILSLCRKSTYKKLFARKGADLFGGSGQLWLEWRYAVRPLIFELDAAVKAYNKQIDKSLRYTARGKNVIPYQESQSTQDVALSNLTITFNKTVKQSHLYRAGVLYSISGDASNLAMVLGIDKPLEVLWELTTLSFVIDWFINIGDIISAHSVSSAFSPLAHWIKEVHQYEETAFNTNAVYNGGDLAANWNSEIRCLQSGSWTKIYRVERRLPVANRSIIPSFKLKLDFSKVVDLTFILKQMFKR
jgi:hypothetical protein